MKLIKASTLALVSLLGLSACAPKSISRLDSSAQVDLSGAWNDVDSQATARTMISDVLGRPWIDQFMQRNKNKPPVVIVGNVRNLSDEHINTSTFIADLERELINSGRIEFVADAKIREALREERVEQDINASAATRKPMGQEYGADYMLVGKINTIVDVEGKQQVRYYQIDIELVSLADNRKAWIGQHKIKKLIDKSNFRF